MKILVTGGAGFIGSHLADTLLEEGHKVTVLDDLSNGHLSYTESARKYSQYQFVKGSVLNKALVSSLVQSHDAVFHLAAVLGVKKCMEDPLTTIEASIFGTHNVATACWIWDKKLVFASTSEVYGKNTALPFHEESNRVLGATTYQRWAYATAKAVDEHVCLGYAQKGLRVTILRYFNMYGPRATATPYAGVIPQMIERAIRDKPVIVHQDGTQTRCFTFVKDGVQATVRALSQTADGLVINVGTSDEIQIKDLADKIVGLSKSGSATAYVPYKEIYGSGYEDSPRRVPFLQRQIEVLGWQAQTSLDEGLRQTIAWHRQEAAVTKEGSVHAEK
ncbi:NAD-dependent epimerase/dehydratase family protein [Alicyclobacillus sp. SO9]|uniref:NAD-dependent epimerase/dehydratase family protein n=1 Tax=Alicyclobacillus sp. SO9 TaxID=2665646 RepID=UPI0018E89621|nr:NAD-dependent epimerase/dehydratase family protein [Alicyclobacillus sp. SO9]QQE80310.1 NAD-dependent epimerase/dehydratase family protein [Alicyclobacillus sp. SO9]